MTLRRSSGFFVHATFLIGCSADFISGPSANDAATSTIVAVDAASSSARRDGGGDATAHGEAGTPGAPGLPDGSDASNDGASEATSDATACGCNGKSNCAVWSNVFVSWYGFNNNGCPADASSGCADIAYPAPVSASGWYGTPYPNAGNITHTKATEGAGTYDDPITAAASADTDPSLPTEANPRHPFAQAGGVTLSPGTLLYDPEVRKYFIMEDSCLDCGDQYTCELSPGDGADGGKAPGGCVPHTNLHVNLWMGPPSAANTAPLAACEKLSSTGAPWVGGPAQIVVNPPSDLPVATGSLYSVSDAGAACWTANPPSDAAVSCL